MSNVGLPNPSFHVPAIVTGAAAITWPLVTSAPHSCGSPPVKLNGRTSVVTGPSKSVRVAPSIRRSTVTGAA